MARGRKSSSEAEILEQQEIEKAQERVIKTKQAYDNAVNILQNLLDKRDARRKDELWKAIIKSEKSYEEILRFIEDDQSTGEA